LLFNLRPGVFEGEDQIRNAELTRKMKFAIVLGALGFFSTSAFRFYQIKNSSRDVWTGLGVIIASYLPAMAYYTYQKS
jgi:hypothetical protein